ncbi:hypothetical protein, partial [Nonomuraea pusilla]
ADTEKTLSDELRQAARLVRENARGTAAGPWKAAPVWSPDAAVTSAVYSHAYPTGTPESEVVASGQKRYRKGGLRNPCNARWIALMNPDLAEPLASWLEETARNAHNHQPAPDYVEGLDVEWCLGCQDEECEGLRNVRAALAVARALNGSSR